MPETLQKETDADSSAIKELNTFTPHLSDEEKRAVSYIMDILGVTKDDICRRAIQEYINLIRNNPDLLHEAITDKLTSLTEKQER